MRCSYRHPEDDFFCEKYQVWYSLRDCNLRVSQRTFEGCVNCFQGRVNLRRMQPRPPLAVGESCVLAFPVARGAVAAAPPGRLPGAAPPKP